MSVHPLLLIGSNIAAFIIGMAGPWHYTDFASTTRSGADTAHRLHRKIKEIRLMLYHVLKSAKGTTESTTDLYKAFIGSHRALESLELDAEDSFTLRDEKLHDEIEAFFASVRGRVFGGHMDIIPALNRGGSLTDPDSMAAKELANLKYALEELDIPACDRLLKTLATISSWPGFARHRLFRARKS